MSNIQIVEIDGQQIVIETFEDGSDRSMPKSVWDELDAQREQSGTL